MKQLILTLGGFMWLYQNYNYPYYYAAPPIAVAPPYNAFVYTGVDRDFYNPSNESSWDRAWRRETEGWR
jgi:hypothetical protein